MDVFIALIVLILSLLVYVVHRRYTYWQRRGLPHDKPRIPKGNMWEWPKTKQIAHVFKDTYQKYKGQGPFAGFYFMFTKMAIITDLELIKNIMIKDFNNFANRGLFFNEEDDPLSATLFTMDDQKWRTLRHKLTPTFTSGKMKTMFPTVVKVGEQLAEVFADKVGNGKILEITDLLGRFTADVIGTCAFGLECNSLQNPKADFVVMGRRAILERRYKGKLDFLLFGFPKLARALHLKITVQEVEDFYFGIVRDTIAYREKNKVKRNDFMDMLIDMKHNYEAGNSTDALTFEEIAAQAFIFFLAGFETSSTTMGFALYQLAKNEEIQSKLRKEINEVLAKHNNEFTYESMKEMQYLEHIIDETLRMYPVLGHLTRITKDRYETSDPKFYIDKGTVVVIPSLAIHYDPDIYPEPEKFKPERFTAEEVQKRPSCTWLPFGEGPRNCIGLRFGKMQTCIGLAYLIRDFKFSFAPDTPVPLKLSSENILLCAVNGIQLKVEKV